MTGLLSGQENKFCGINKKIIMGNEKDELLKTWFN